MHFNVLGSSLQVIDRVIGFHMKRCHSQFTPPNSSPPSTPNSSPPNTPNRTPPKGDLDDTISPLPSPMPPLKPALPPLKPACMDTPSLGAKKLMLQYKQSKVSSHPSAIINLTKSPPRKKLKSPKTWIQNNLYTLSVSANNRILSPTAWLSDDIIEATQALIRDSNPLMGGLQLPYLGQTGPLSIERGQFI